MAKIKTLEELEEFSTEITAQNEAFKVTLEVMEAAQKVADEQRETLKTENAQYVEKLKTLQTLVKAREAILQESTPEAAAYKIGKIVQMMKHNHHSVQRGNPGDGKAMLDLGATPTSLVGPYDKAPSEIVPEFMDHYNKQYNKSQITSTPFASDESTFFGQYLVPVDTNAELLRIAAGASRMMGQVWVRPIRGTTTYLPKTTDAFVFTRVTDERTAKTEESLTVGRTTLTCETYAFWIGVTEEMDEDSLIGLGELIRKMGGEAWAKKYDQLCLSDTSYGAMSTSGILEQVMGAGDTNFGSIDLPDLDNMIKKLTSDVLRSGAMFFMHTTVWDELVNLTDSNGNYKIRRFSETAPLMVRGYPVVLTDGMPALAASAASTSFVAFGNPSYIVNGDRVGFEFRIFDQTEATMQYDIITLRCRLRQAFALWAAHAWVKLTTAAI